MKRSIRVTLISVVLVCGATLLIFGLLRFILHGTLSLSPGASSPEQLEILAKRLASSGYRMGNPVFIRIFKRENILELWMKRDDRFALFESYPICSWSGELGPKLREGDRQSPEGFYTVSQKQLHPTSRYHRAFNLGYPNAYDKQLERTGSFLMVHGACVSIGCYAMTNKVITDIYNVMEAAFQAGQREVSVQIFPFRMVDDALGKEARNQWYPFWKNLKEGHDLFEQTGLPPEMYACHNRYVPADRIGTSSGCERISGW